VNTREFLARFPCI